MEEYLKIWFLDVGHGDCAYIEMPNGARMMVDCGGSDNWAFKLLKHYKITKKESPNAWGYALDELVISHPHGDHISDIIGIHDEIGFKWLQGGYRNFIDEIKQDDIDFRKRNKDAVLKFISVVKNYNAEYKVEEDRVAAADPPCKVESKRFLQYEKDIDLNELSWFTTLEIGGKKVLFTGDMTSAGVKRILESKRASEFKEFLKKTTVVKVPHHGRVNGCSKEMFEALGDKPLLCIASDKVLDNTNEGTSNISWYGENTSDDLVLIDGKMEKRKVLTARKDGDIYLSISKEGEISVVTNCFKDVREKIMS